MCPSSGDVFLCILFIRIKERHGAALLVLMKRMGRKRE
jgi:hypothetical protein